MGKIAKTIGGLMLIGLGAGLGYYVPGCHNENPNLIPKKPKLGEFEQKATSLDGTCELYTNIGEWGDLLFVKNGSELEIFVDKDGDGLTAEGYFRIETYGKDKLLDYTKTQRPVLNNMFWKKRAKAINRPFR